MESGSGTGFSKVSPQHSSSTESNEPVESSFGDVVDLVNRRSEALVLANGRNRASIAVWPAMQGRVLCSSPEGMDGRAFGWVNHELISSGERLKQVNAVGGEDRIWLGPEGGQFSLFFAPGVPFHLDHWNTPAPLDTEPFEIVDLRDDRVLFTRSFEVLNYSGSKFQVRINRQVRLLKEEAIWAGLKLNRKGRGKVVGFESDNELSNLGSTAWSKESGLISLWVLGQFQATSRTSIILPIRPGSVAELGVAVTSDYFGAVPEERISVRADSVLFRADGNCRSKLGLSSRRSRGMLGSYDAITRVLTIVQFSQSDEDAEYVNSAWRLQEEPYRGDVANCYNDGPSYPGGSQLGKFYELESSSPAIELKPGGSVSHVQRTIHLSGSEDELDQVSMATLGVHLEDALTLTGLSAEPRR